MSRLQGHSGNAGPSIIELIWSELDSSFADLSKMSNKKAGDPVLHPKYIKLQGSCFGLATALAILTNTYDPDVNAIREEAMARFRARLG